MNKTIRKFAKVLSRPLKPLANKALDRQVQQRTGLAPIDATNKDDIFIAGYPKSGNTWMQNLVAGLLYGMDMELVPDGLIQEIVPDVHTAKFYRRYGTPTFFKTHHLPRPQYRRVVHLVRDGRDAMVSYYHFRAAIEGQQPNFTHMISTGEGLFPCKWHEHTAAWLANPYDAKLMTLTYEALKEDTLAELRRLCDFAEWERDRQLLENVARTCAFDAMREKEKRMGWANSIWPKDKYFVRRGTVGSFKDEMPADAMVAFMKEAGPTLLRMGYPEV